MRTPQLKYKEVEQEIRQLAKTLPVGAKIPPERHLATTYNCNFLTVRKALKALVDDGIIVRRVGSGSFVADKPVTLGSPPITLGTRIGLLVYQNSNTYAHKVLQSIAHSAMEMGLDLRSVWVKGYDQDSLQQAQALANEGCIALVLPWFPLSMTSQVRDFVEKCPLPVSIPLFIAGLERNYFGKPELFGSGLLRTTGATCHYLRELGRETIAFLGPATPEDPVLQKMLTAYTAYVSDNHLGSHAFLAGTGSTPMDNIARQWSAHKGKLGIVCYDDEHALRLMTAMNKAGLQAPEDYTIIGHNDTEASLFSDPPLSTIGHDFPHASEGLLRNALALSKGQTHHTESEPISKLFIRGSCGGAGKVDKKLIKKFASFINLVESTHQDGNDSQVRFLPLEQP